MLRDLIAKLYDMDQEQADAGTNPGASARRS